ncbi:hypothetical protein [Shewanella sp. ENK2]|uniref:hypothetical protein n=2 Tax=unclassified Shewanella TaxID=196818 RepID=UPI003748558C
MMDRQWVFCVVVAVLMMLLGAWVAKTDAVGLGLMAAGLGLFLLSFFTAYLDRDKLKTPDLAQSVIKDKNELC